MGEFNVRNTAMAISVALAYKLPVEVIESAVARFAGVARRQEIRGEVNGIKVIDDFGHHPTAIRETLSALRFRYPGQKILAIFEPRRRIRGTRNPWSGGPKLPRGEFRGETAEGAGSFSASPTANPVGPRKRNGPAG